jgi:hypothetical protein
MLKTPRLTVLRDPDYQNLRGRKMRYAALLGLGFATYAATLAFPSEANAVVCARGVYRAGCVAPAAGAAVVRPAAPAAVVVRPAPRVRVVR